MKFSTAATLVAAAAVASAQTSYANGTVTTTTEVVTEYTTYCPSPTTFTENGQVYTVTAATTLTITDCPCTRTHIVTLSTTTSCPTEEPASTAAPTEGPVSWTTVPVTYYTTIPCTDSTGGPSVTTVPVTSYTTIPVTSAAPPATKAPTEAPESKVTEGTTSTKSSVVPVAPEETTNPGTVAPVVNGANKVAGVSFAGVVAIFAALI